MTTLLVLGSKPDPALPPPGTVDAVACANGSGASARACGLPDPAYTVMTALLTAGEGSGTRSLDAISGLGTDVLWYVPRPSPSGSWLKRLRRLRRAARMRPGVLERELTARRFTWNRLIVEPHTWYMDRVRAACNHEPAACEQLARKHPSTGLVAVALGLTDGRHDRVVVAGFSFQLTHAYTHNPEIDRRGTAQSAHAATDVAVLRAMARAHPGLMTTELTVAERAGLPMLGIVPADKD